MRMADTTLITSSNVLEEGSLVPLRTWYESVGKTLWTVGPPNPPQERARDATSRPSSEGEQVLAFLDRVYETHGDKSIVFVNESIPFFTPSNSPTDFLRIILLAWQAVSSLGRHRRAPRLENAVPFRSSLSACSHASGAQPGDRGKRDQHGSTVGSARCRPRPSGGRMVPHSWRMELHTRECVGESSNVG
jgi:hypothetical protein